MDLSREQLLQFLSPEAAADVLASPEDLLAGRRLDVSVLSCDVAAFRPRAEADPRTALEALNRILAELAVVVLAEDGTLMSFPGDGVLAVFGAPLAREDHRLVAERARARIAGPVLDQLNENLAASGLGPVALDVAVASGPATVGVIGAEPRWEYAAIGTPTAAAIAATSS